MPEARTELEMHKPGNRNTDWILGRGTWITYILIILGLRTFLGFTSTDPYVAWTIINVSHSLITFMVFHWIKGNPFESTLKYDKHTLWEQIDYGVQWTTTRKFLMIVPISLFLISVNSNDMKFDQLFLINATAFIVVTIAKMPFMNKKRILGINA